MGAVNNRSRSVDVSGSLSGLCVKLKVTLWYNFVIETFHIHCIKVIVLEVLKGPKLMQLIIIGISLTATTV